MTSTLFTSGEISSEIHFKRVFLLLNAHRHRPSTTAPCNCCPNVRWEMTSKRIPAPPPCSWSSSSAHLPPVVKLEMFTNLKNYSIYIYRWNLGYDEGTWWPTSSLMPTISSRLGKGTRKNRNINHQVSQLGGGGAGRCKMRPPTYSSGNTRTMWKLPTRFLACQDIGGGLPALQQTSKKNLYFQNSCSFWDILLVNLIKQQLALADVVS